MAGHDPQTPEQWQEAMDAAHAVVLVEAARRLGFIAGGPTVNLERCAEILAGGKDRGYSAERTGVYDFLFQTGAAAEVHEAMAKLERMADGGLLSAALLGTPLQDYAIDEIYQPEGPTS